MTVHTNSLKWDCHTHGYFGQLSPDTVVLRPLMPPKDVFAEVERKAEAACERKIKAALKAKAEAEAAARKS